jgi:hypothetical protein
MESRLTDLSCCERREATLKSLRGLRESTVKKVQNLVPEARRGLESILPEGPGVSLEAFHRDDFYEGKKPCILPDAPPERARVAAKPARWASLIPQRLAHGVLDWSAQTIAFSAGAKPADVDAWRVARDSYGKNSQLDELIHIWVEEGIHGSLSDVKERAEQRAAFYENKIANLTRRLDSYVQEDPEARDWLLPDGQAIAQRIRSELAAPLRGTGYVDVRKSLLAHADSLEAKGKLSFEDALAEKNSYEPIDGQPVPGHLRQIQQVIRDEVHSKADALYYTAHQERPAQFADPNELMEAVVRLGYLGTTRDLATRALSSANTARNTQLTGYAQMGIGAGLAAIMTLLLKEHAPTAVVATSAGAAALAPPVIRAVSQTAGKLAPRAAARPLYQALSGVRDEQANASGPQSLRPLGALS